MQARCPSCFRTERWEGGRRDVLTPGGDRRPALHPALAAWRTLRQAQLAGRSVVAVCPACNQPMLSDDPEAAAIAWSLPLPDGSVLVGPAGILGPNGPESPEALEARIVAAYPPPGGVGPGERAFQGLAVFVFVVPFALWLLGMLFVAWFLGNIFQPAAYGI